VAIDDLATRCHPPWMPLRCCRAPPILGRQELPPRDYDGSISSTGHIVGFKNVK